MGAVIFTIVAYFVLSAWGRRAISYKVDFKFLAKVVLAILVMGICLNFIKIRGALSIVLTVIAGVAVFGLGLFMLMASSGEDRRLVREALSGLNPK